MPAGFLRHTALASVRAYPRLQVAFSAPAPQSPAQFTQSGSDVTDSAERGRGAESLASAHPEPPLVPGPDLCHAPTLADPGDLCRKGVGRGVKTAVSGAPEDSVRSLEQGVKGPGERVRAKGVCAGTPLPFIPRRGQEELCGSLSHHVHEVGQDGMNEGCGVCPRVRVQLGG